MLCLMEAEYNQAIFQEQMEQFSNYCLSFEPGFQKYFMQYYANRPGMLHYNTLS